MEKTVIVKLDHPTEGSLYKKIIYRWSLELSYEEAFKRHQEASDVFTSIDFVGISNEEEFLNQK